MAYDIHVSFNSVTAVAVQNFFAAYPDVSPSRLIKRLLLEHIKEERPELLELREILKEVKPDVDDYLGVLKETVEKTPEKKINKAQAAYVLHKTFGLELKMAEKKLKGIPDSLFAKGGLEWQNACLIPFKPYFPEKKAGAKGAGK